MVIAGTIFFPPKHKALARKISMKERKQFRAIGRIRIPKK